MTKKKVNIILILVVVGLWGTVLYKSVNRYLFPQVIKQVIPTKKFSGILKSKDTFSLKPLTRDPFLNKTSAITSPSRPKRINKKPITMPDMKKSSKIWPSILYYGYLLSKTKNEQTVLVKINQKIYKLKKDTQIDGIKFNKVYNDSIELIFNKEKKIFRISK